MMKVCNMLVDNSKSLVTQTVEQNNLREAPTGKCEKASTADEAEVVVD
jgi:hypothetical protein